MSSSISQRYREDVEALQAELGKAREFIRNVAAMEDVKTVNLAALSSNAKAFLSHTDEVDNG